MPLCVCITGAVDPALPDHPETFRAYDRQDRDWICDLPRELDGRNPVEAPDAPFGEIRQLMRRLGSSGLLDGNSRVVDCQVPSINELRAQLSQPS